MLGGKVPGHAARLAVDDEVDAALAVQHHVFAAVLGHQGEAHFFKHGLQQTGGGRGEFDKLEPAQAHGVFKQIGHGGLQVAWR